MPGRECYHCKQWIGEGEPHDCWTTTEGARATSAARQLFAYSILYLFGLFAVLLIESVAGRLVAGHLAG